MQNNIGEIVDAPVRRRQARKYSNIAELLPGKAVLVRWAAVYYCDDPQHAVRNAAYYWGKQLGWKLRTMVDQEDGGIYIIRDR